MDRAVMVIGALLLNSALGGPRQWYEVLGLTRFTRLPATFVRDIERRLNRDHRAPKDRELRGQVLVVADIIGCLALGGMLSWLTRHGLWLIEPLLLAMLLPLRPAWDLALQIRRGLASGDALYAREALAHTAWRHYTLLDEAGLGRAAIEILAVHFSEKIVAPIFWYLLFGLPGFFISKSIFLLQETLNPKDEAEEFGKAAYWAHYVLHYLPSRLAAVLWLAVSVFLPSKHTGEMARQLTGFARGSPQFLALQATAGALNLSLGGPSSLYAHEWIGGGSPRPTAYHVRRALYLFGILCLMLLVILGFFL